MDKQVSKVIDGWCQKWSVKRQEVEDALRRVEAHDWSEFIGEKRYGTWKRDHELLAAVACELIREIGLWPKPFEVWHPDGEGPTPKFSTWEEAVAAKKKFNAGCPGHIARKRRDL